MRTRTVPALDRFAESFEVLDNGCWAWTGKITDDSYGAIGYRGHRHVLAHRAVYEEVVGPIAAGLTLDHLCHTLSTDCMGGVDCPHRRCVNPDHLEPVTALENNQRSGHRRPACIHGHRYTPENTYENGGKRYCIACWTARHGHPPVKVQVPA